MLISLTSMAGRAAAIGWLMLACLTAGSSLLDPANWLRNMLAAAIFLGIGGVGWRYFGAQGRSARGGGNWARLVLALLSLLFGYGLLAAAVFRVFVERYAVFG